MKFLDLANKNQIYALLAKGIEASKVVGLNVVVSRVYGPEQLGIYSYVLGIASIIAVLAEFRLQSILVREFSRGDIAQSKLIGTSLCINTFFAFLGMSILFILSFFEENRLAALSLIIYSFVFLYKIPRLFRGLYIASERNSFIVRSEFFASIFTFFLIFMVVFLDMEFEFFVVARSLDFLFISLVFIWIYVSYIRNKVSISFDLNVCKKLILSSAPLVLSGAAMILFQRVDIVFVRAYLGDYEAGIYSSATSIMMLFSLVPIVLSESLAPKLFRSNRSDETSQGMAINFSVIIISVGFFFSFLLYFSSYYLLLILYGEEYLQSMKAMLILSITPILIAFGSVAGQIIVAENTQQWAYIKSLIGCGVTLISNYILVPLMGIEGAAISTLLGLLFANLLCHYFIRPYRSIFRLQIDSVILMFKLPIVKLRRSL